MEISSTVRTAREAAQAVKNATGKLFTGRPFNFHDPDNSAWWLYRGTEWPAYRYAKLFFQRSETSPDTMFCGLYFEKGYGRAIAELPGTKAEHRLLMQPDWAWHRILQDFKNNKIQPLLDSISENTRAVPLLAAYSFFYTDTGSEYDPDKQEHDKGRTYTCRFNYIQETKSLLPAGAHTPAPNPDIQKLADIMDTVHDVPQFGESLAKLENNSWIWVDVYVGLEFQFTKNMSKNVNLGWGGGTIWDKYLILFRPWLL